MATTWFVSVRGQDHGPLSSAQLKQLANSGTISPHTSVRRSTDVEWTPAARVRGLFGRADQASLASTSGTAKTKKVPPVIKSHPGDVCVEPDSLGPQRIQIAVDPPGRRHIVRRRHVPVLVSVYGWIFMVVFSAVGLLYLIVFVRILAMLPPGGRLGTAVAAFSFAEGLCFMFCAVGLGLTRADRNAVYGLIGFAGLAAASAIFAFALGLPPAVALTMAIVSVFFLPPVVIAFRHWNEFH